MIQRIAIILLSLSLFAPAIITISCLKYQKTKVRKQVKRIIMEGVDPYELVHFTFHVKDTATLLRWEHHKEFEFQEQMYDIVKRTYFEDSVTYLCWWDHAETALNKELSETVFNLLKKNPFKSKTQDKFVTFYKSLYCTEEPTFDHVQISDISESQFRYVSLFSGVSTQPPFPPPDI